MILKSDDTEKWVQKYRKKRGYSTKRFRFAAPKDFSNKYNKLIVCNLNSEIASFLSTQKRNKKVGLVPTMGALHEGHLALIEKASRESDIVICSIFVNPAQFNDPADFDKYPRNHSKDIDLLKSVDCDVLYLPSIEEVYQNEETFLFDFGGLDSSMEGLHRPGHFDGVVRVVKRLFEITCPTQAYFGLKDYQQFLIVRKLAHDFFPNLKIIGVETLREDSGLAKSSRNELLSPEGKKNAASIYQALDFCKTYHAVLPIAELKLKAVDILEGIESVEYLEIADAQSLTPASVITPENPLRVFIAVKMEGIRLIDNLAIN